MNTRKTEASAIAELEAEQLTTTDNVMAYLQIIMSLNLYMLNEMVNGTHIPAYLPSLSQQFILFYCGFPTNFGTETNPQISQLSDQQLLTNHRIVTLSNNTALLNIMLTNLRFTQTFRDVESQVVSSETAVAAAAGASTAFEMPTFSSSRVALFSTSTERAPSPIATVPGLTEEDINEWLQSIDQPSTPRV